MTARKTRAQRNAEAVGRKKSRAIPRVTQGRFTFEKAVIEVEARKFIVADEAEELWDLQSYCSRKRKIRVMHHGSQRDICLDGILSGNTMSCKPTSAGRKASSAKISATRIARDFGQQHWMESAGIHAAMKVLDPQGLLEVCHLPDGLGPDFLLRPVDSTEDAWVPVQMKTAEAHDGCVYLHVDKKDGLPGGIYENMIIVCAILKVDRPAAKKTMQVFGAIPEVEVTELFLYRSASDIPCPSLNPYPRRKHDDKYGDNRFVFGFDYEERLETIQVDLMHLVRTIPQVTYEEACCSFGPGTLNVNLSEKHEEEVLNIKALAQILGMESLRAPALQNLTTDIIWQLEDVGINISLKTAQVDNDGRHGGYRFSLGTAPYAEHCHVVMVFYKEGTVRTHVSVICAHRVYVPTRATFCWSPTNNADVIEEKIDLRQSDALENLMIAVVACMN